MAGNLKEARLLACAGPAAPAQSVRALYLGSQKHKTGNLDLTSEVTLVGWEAAIWPSGSNNPLNLPNITQSHFISSGGCLQM